MQAMLTETMMREALGLPIPLPSVKPAMRTGGQRRPRIKVVLSVRKPGGGICYRFEHEDDTISEFEARMNAEKAARKAGYQPWVLLEVIRC